MSIHLASLTQMNSLSMLTCLMLYLTADVVGKYVLNIRPWGHNAFERCGPIRVFTNTSLVIQSFRNNNSMLI